MIETISLWLLCIGFIFIITAVILLMFEYYRAIIDKLEDIKTARLINANPYGKCSNCGALIDIRDGFGYCPYCGSMLGENNNE